MDEAGRLVLTPVPYQFGQKGTERVLAQQRKESLRGIGHFQRGFERLHCLDKLLYAALAHLFVSIS
jgi:hypothetical protein